ncbi:MAG: transglycosylase SLT domain-containing protein [Parvibaculum sp.]
MPAIWSVAVAMGLALAIAPTFAQAQSQPRTSRASSADAKPSPWAFCERATVQIEVEHKMPRALLFSVAMAESGRFNPEARKTRPWPWTINAEGQSFYFKSKADAIAATHRLLKEGVRSIDVGCMQVNLRYHPDAFADLDDAFDPVTNVTYGASFLKSLHGRTQSWPDAIAAYHSQSKTRNQPYFARVIGIWVDEHTRIADLARKLKAEAVASADAPLRETLVETVAIVAAETPRPAPMVIDGGEISNVREAAVATVGLRLSIADDEFAPSGHASQRRAPHVLEAPRSAPTVLADASPSF